MKQTNNKEKLDRIVAATLALQLAQAIGIPSAILIAMRELRDACDDFSQDYAPRIDEFLAIPASAVEAVC